jgi:hypothetical protein
MLTDEQISNLQERLSMAHLNDEAKISIDINVLQILVNVHRNRVARDAELTAELNAQHEQDRWEEEMISARNEK